MASPTATHPPREPEPAWEIARLFPNQGQWDELDYLTLTRHGQGLVELSDGCIEVLATPTMSHQLIVAFLYRALLAFLSARDLGRVLFAPLRVRLRPGQIREPDIVFMLKDHSDRMGEECWEGADLVIEVVSDDPECRQRDYEAKRRDYARAGIPEYWIVDPHSQRITILRLEGRDYRIHGEHTPGQRAASALLSGFEVDVDDVFEVAKDRS